MSHRDPEGHIAPRSHAQDLVRVFEWLLAGVDLGGVGFRRDSHCSPRGLMLLALLWVWSEESTLGRRCAAAQKIAGRLWPADVRARVSYQAFLKRLVRWSRPLLATITILLRARMQTALAARWHVAGYCVFGVDGSRLELPRTASNEGRFAAEATRLRLATRRSRRPSIQTARSRLRKGEVPQLWLTTMWHAGTGLPWDWRTGAADSSERAHLDDMIAALPAEALVTADAGFVGYDYWKTLLDSGRQFLIRVGGNVRLLRRLGVVRESHGTVYLWPDRAARRGQPPLVLRLVVVHDGRQPWFLVTSVGSRSRLSDRQVAELYRLRWGIELFYRHFKQTFGRRKLRSHTAAHVLCEADWSIVGLWALLLHAAVHLHRHHLPVERLSVAVALTAYRTALREYKSHPDPGESLLEILTTAVVDDYHRRHKQSRGYPRKKYDPPPGAPQITIATPHQARLAREITAERAKKGLTA